MTALRKLLICPWFGPFPPWWERYYAQTPRLKREGYDTLLVWGLSDFKERVKDRLGIDCPIEEGGTKIHDYRATFGELFADELRGYDFWGHTDFDCVYGRPAHFMPDEQLAELDIHSDHWNYICGPWTLYRNLPTVNNRFRDRHDWEEILKYPETTGWVEAAFTQVINRSGLRVRYELCHGWQHADKLRWDGPALLERGREISFYHFRQSKQWPVIR